MSPSARVAAGTSVVVPKESVNGKAALLEAEHRDACRVTDRERAHPPGAAKRDRGRHGGHGQHVVEQQPQVQVLGHRGDEVEHGSIDVEPVEVGA